MVFYGRLLKIIYSYFSLGQRKGKKLQVWNAHIRFTHCLIALLILHICSEVSNHYFGHEKSPADEHSCGKKSSLFPLEIQIIFLCASRSDVNNRKYLSGSNTLWKALCDSSPWPIWASVQTGSQKLESDSLFWPTLSGHMFQPI